MTTSPATLGCVTSPQSPESHGTSTPDAISTTTCTGGAPSQISDEDDNLDDLPDMWARMKTTPAPSATVVFYPIWLRIGFLILLVGKTSTEDIHSCRNFLFEQHWFSAEGSKRSLLKYPELISDLRLCPVYNGQASCCQTGVEHEQALHFAYWKQIFKGKIARVKQSKMATLEIKDDLAFNSATHEDRQQFEIAIEKYDKILDPMAGHARCFSTLSVYAAGMICFACDTHWRNKVHMAEGEKLLRILIPEGNCAASGIFAYVRRPAATLRLGS
eukprot:symbB.v1.2.023246.t1/scaffold2077.1/size90278/6